MTILIITVQTYLEVIRQLLSNSFKIVRMVSQAKNKTKNNQIITSTAARYTRWALILPELG